MLKLPNRLEHDINVTRKKIEQLQDTGVVMFQDILKNQGYRLNVSGNMDSLPFEQIFGDNFRIRIFSQNVDENELKWHQDEENRFIIPLHDTDWKIQLDNQLPISLIKNQVIEIPKYLWHRVIKGSNNLKIKIIFANENFNQKNIARTRRNNNTSTISLF